MVQCSAVRRPVAVRGDTRAASVCVKVAATSDPAAAAAAAAGGVGGGGVCSEPVVLGDSLQADRVTD